jgi:aminoglycoside/choline kinase family phosphotransferase
MENPMTTLFQTNIEQLLKAHNLLEKFHSQDEFHVRFDMPHYDRLVIERHNDLISVAHYFEQNGNLIADPDVELHYPTWTPTSITQIFGYRSKFIERDGKTFVDTRFHRDVSSFLVMWAQNIKAQGWAEKGKVIDAEP